jgi:RNA polymerase sigma-70 factor (ECF subfamily)
MEGARTDGPVAGPGALAPDEFARRFQAAGRLFWTIAAGVLGEVRDVDDVLQEACVAALEKLDSYREDANFSAWAGRFVRHAALNHARKRVRRSTRTAGPAELAELEESSGGAALRPVPSGAEVHVIDARGALVSDQAAFDDALLAALGELGPTQRAALLLRTVHELSYRELSLVLEIPEGTAMSHVHRGLRTLREALFASEKAAPRASGGKRSVQP